MGIFAGGICAAEESELRFMAVILGGPLRFVNRLPGDPQGLHSCKFPSEGSMLDWSHKKMEARMAISMPGRLA